MRRLLIFLSFLLLLSACIDNQEEVKLKDKIISSFQEEGIHLEVQKDNSKSFDFPESKEENYDFEGGRIILFYNFGNRERIKERIDGNLAVMEFTHSPEVYYYDDFAIIYFPHTDHQELNEKVRNALDKLKA
ncbi:hypothetical protein [Bacillus sp. B-jedd]|uniref:hypothetical protein n=1 Tax=Bacillus sp. B-jedd TaxID=1476857 RepID=UPI0005155E2D|nr:hypothetical protein [Bacillus sp. B-jedd]CEG26179.1 hypothetical protein BN1002_01020 [Bacillus sp. B-jedd]